MLSVITIPKIHLKHERQSFDPTGCQILKAQVPTYRRKCDSPAISCLFLGREGSKNVVMCVCEVYPSKRPLRNVPWLKPKSVALKTPPPESALLTRDFSDHLGIPPRAKPKSANLGTMVSRSWQVRQLIRKSLELKQRSSIAVDGRLLGGEQDVLRLQVSMHL